MSVEPAAKEPQNLAGRVVIVTGAGRGLGATVVETLLSRGALVVANHRSPAHTLGELAEKWGESLLLVEGDIAEEETAQLIADRTKQKYGRLDAVVHNAAITRDGPLITMSAENWDAVQRVNLRGAFLMTKYGLRLMIRRRSGRMIYISSVSATMGNASQANYAASKAGLHGLSNAVAQEYGRYNIRSVVVAPGLLDTGLGTALADEVRELKASRSLGGIGSGDQIAAVIAFLAGGDADYINATTIRVDGGIAF